MSSSRRGTGYRTRFRTGFGTRFACRLPRVAAGGRCGSQSQIRPANRRQCAHQMAAGSHPTHHAGRIGTGYRSRFPRPGGTVIREGLALVEPLVLASRSPQRRAILTQLGVRFEVVEPAYDEVDPPGAAPEQLVVEHARGKARSVDGEGRWVLGVDTTVAIDGRSLAKPADEQEAAEMLRNAVRPRARRPLGSVPARRRDRDRSAGIHARPVPEHRAVRSGLVPGLGGVARAGRRLCRPGPRRRVRGRDRRRPLERRRAARDRAGGSARPGSRGGWLIQSRGLRRNLQRKKQGADDRDSQLIDRVRWP